MRACEDADVTEHELPIDPDLDDLPDKIPDHPVPLLAPREFSPR